MSVQSCEMLGHKVRSHYHRGEVTNEVSCLEEIYAIRTDSLNYYLHYALLPRYHIGSRLVLVPIGTRTYD